MEAPHGAPPWTDPHLSFVRLLCPLQMDAPREAHAVVTRQRPLQIRVGQRPLIVREDAALESALVGQVLLLSFPAWRFLTASYLALLLTVTFPAAFLLLPTWHFC